MELQAIQNKIYEIRGARVMLDFDLAALYGVETKRLKEAVRRNIERFEGEDFMFELTEFEYNSLIISLRSQFASSNLTSQIVISSLNFPTENSNERGGRRYMPFAFTEVGVAMLSSVLRSETAILVNRSIIRAFVEMRNYLMSTATITAELSEIRTKLQLLERNDEENMAAINDLSEDIRRDIDVIYTAIAEMSARPVEDEKPRRRIGYRTGSSDD